ncbi:MAG: cyanophycinase, partial [Flavobacteriales bacterium]
MKNLYLLTALLFLATSASGQYTNWITGDESDSDAQPSPGIVIMGGASEHDEAMKWFLEQANGGDVVVIRASGSDGYNDYMFSDLGVDVNSVETIRFDTPSAAQNAYVIEQLQNAEAIWIAGGDQYDYVSFWQGTPIEDAINNLMNNIGGPVGGTSAGMAILCGRYFSAEEGTITSAEALANPFAEEVTLGNQDFLDVPFLNDVVTDTHYDDPDRRGRHVAFLSRLFDDSQGMSKGIACDEYTAISINSDGIATVWGDEPDYFEYIYFIQSNCETLGPEILEDQIPLTWNQNNTALSVYKIRGDNEGTRWFDLNDWTTG